MASHQCSDHDSEEMRKQLGFFCDSEKTTNKPWQRSQGKGASSSSCSETIDTNELKVKKVTFQLHAETALGDCMFLHPGAVSNSVQLKSFGVGSVSCELRIVETCGALSWVGSPNGELQGVLSELDGRWVLMKQGRPRFMCSSSTQLRQPEKSVHQSFEGRFDSSRFACCGFRHFDKHAIVLNCSFILGKNCCNRDCMKD